MKQYLRKLAFLFLMAVYVHASAVDCQGTVDTLSFQMDGSGTVTLSLSGGPTYTYICNTLGTLNGVPAADCRTMYATLMAAKLTGKQVLIRFYNYSTCATVPSWGASGPMGWTMVLL